jgi:hypothetical protein
MRSLCFPESETGCGGECSVRSWPRLRPYTPPAELARRIDPGVYRARRDASRPGLAIKPVPTIRAQAPQWNSLQALSRPPKQRPGIALLAHGCRECCDRAGQLLCQLLWIDENTRYLHRSIPTTWATALSLRKGNPKRSFSSTPLATAPPGAARKAEPPAVLNPGLAP